MIEKKYIRSFKDNNLFCSCGGRSYIDINCFEWHADHAENDGITIKDDIWLGCIFQEKDKIKIAQRNFIN